MENEDMNVDAQPPEGAPAPCRFDLTPEGLKTPEGRARVAAAREALDAATAACAVWAADVFLEARRTGGRLRVGTIRRGEQALAERSDAYDGLIKAMTGW